MKRTIKLLCMILLLSCAASCNKYPYDAKSIYGEDAEALYDCSFIILNNIDKAKIGNGESFSLAAIINSPKDIEHIPFDFGVPFDFDKYSLVVGSVVTNGGNIRVLNQYATLKGRGVVLHLEIGDNKHIGTCDIAPRYFAAVYPKLPDCTPEITVKFID